ncbi:MAG: SDR family oxidoreductase [Actinomycetota bacterium]|nr:SDR family oxidoreductase [Actinomycetota bacterium]
MPVAVITGASRGLGRALAAVLAERGWSLVVDGRDPVALDAAAQAFYAVGAEELAVHPGDVTDPGHRAVLAESAAALGGSDVLVNNASTLGRSPLPRITDLDASVLAHVYATNAVAPLALTRLLLPQLLSGRGRVLNVSSDAAVQPYPGWAGYGSSKAALELISAVLAVEHPGLRVYAVDPGDMRTRMHQEAFPGEDISDRPAPESVVPALLRLVDGELPSGRYRAADLLVQALA